jgi:hypothetical protein
MPQWKGMSDPARLSTLRQIALPAGRDPRIATLAVQILRSSGVRPREHRRAAAALLAFVQDRIFYVNEPGERLQDPTYTLRVGYGDCDDMALLLAALCESLRLPWRFVISGRRGDRIVRWVEGTPYQHANWSHIYLAIGNRPFAPTHWWYAEPTLKKPLGWDVVRASKGGTAPLPELAGVESTDAPSPKKDELTVRAVVADIRKELHPRRLIVGVIVGVVTGIIAALTIRPIVERVIPRKRRR